MVDQDTKIRQLALLCCERRMLTDEELEQISAHGEEVHQFLYHRGEFARQGAALMLHKRRTGVHKRTRNH